MGAARLFGGGAVGGGTAPPASAAAVGSRLPTGYWGDGATEDRGNGATEYWEDGAMHWLRESFTRQYRCGASREAGEGWVALHEGWGSGRAPSD